MSSETTKTEVGNYFISNYPPFSCWKRELVDEARQAMQQPPAAVPLGLYLHIPFCRKRCKFCYFKVFTDKRADDIEQYMAALAREIELVSRQPVMGGRPFRFVYFGGGTPSFLSVRQLQSLVDRLRANIDWSQAEEVTFECEPGTLAEPKVQALRELGVTRLSLGVENFSDAVLQENGRAHLSAEIDRAWEWIRAAGVSQREHRPDRRHGGRDLGQLAAEHSPDARTGARQRHDLPDGTAVQHGLLAGHPGPQDRKRRWPTGRRNGRGSTMPSTNCWRPAITSRAPTRW